MPRLMLAKSRTACVVCRELSSGLELAVSCRIQGVRVTILERPAGSRPTWSCTDNAVKVFPFQVGSGISHGKPSFG